MICGSRCGNVGKHVFYIFISLLVPKAYKLKRKLDVEHYCIEVNCTIIGLNCLVNTHPLFNESLL